MKSILILGSPTCGPCNQAKALLERTGLEYTFLNTAESFEYRNVLIAAGFQTIPQIFIDGTHIGGKDDLVAHLSAHSGVND